MVAGVLGGLDQLGHDVLGRAQVGIAHPEVDDILARERAFVFRSLTIEKTYGGRRLMR